MLFLLLFYTSRLSITMEEQPPTTNYISMMGDYQQQQHPTGCCTGWTRLILTMIAVVVMLAIKAAIIAVHLTPKTITIPTSIL